MKETAKWAIVLTGALLLIGGIAAAGIGWGEVSSAITPQCYAGEIGCAYSFTCAPPSNCTDITSIIPQQPQFPTSPQSFQQQSNQAFGGWVTMVSGIILAPIGLIIMIVGFLIKPDQNRESSSSNQTSRHILCKRCGAENNYGEEQKFCAKCGADLKA